MAKYRKVGQVLKGKDGKGFYIKMDEDVTLTKGQIVNVNDPRKQPAELLALGVISEETAADMQKRAEALPEWVKFNLTVKT